MTSNYPTFENGSTHIDGTDDSATVAASSLDANLNYTGSTCFGSGNTGFTSCHSGVGDDGTWARLWDNTVSYDTGGTLVECAGCHGGFNNDWTYDGTQAGNTDHTKDWDTAQSSGDGAEVIGNHANTTNATKCNICHVYADAPYDTTWSTGDHGDGAIQMNSTMGYSTSAFNCSTNCHSETWGNTDHNLEDSGWANGPIAGPALACTGCHSGHGTGSAGLGNDSPHAGNTGFTCEGCHTGHNQGTIQISNNTAVGINYGTGGIDLGGSSAPGATEQEICNGCHGATHQPWNMTQGAYDTGTLSSYTNWTGAAWTSANFSEYKTGAAGWELQSNHYSTAGMACSYCHDVHDTNNSHADMANTDTINGDTNSDGVIDATPLRGTWISNPFPEDGAPTTTNSGNFAAGGGPVPRGLGSSNYAVQNTIGGWQIEQNNPSAYARTGNYSTFAGLCENCHAAADLMGAASFSGHDAAVDGFQAGGGNDILQLSYRGGDGAATTSGYMKHAESTGEDGNYVYGLREGKTRSNNISPTEGTPQTSGLVQTVLTQAGTGMDSFVEPDFHEFPCSKCHSPHASALPRLMITNCLDIQHNNWDDTINPSTWNDSFAGDGHNYSATELAYSPTAANCHRRVEDTGKSQTGSTEPGWNAVTPWSGTAP